MTHPPEVSSVSELIDWVQSDTSNPVDGSRWYRGHQSAKYQLLPGARRNGGGIDSLLLEQSMAQEFKTKAPARYSKCPPDDDYIGWMTLMQHYGLPTRLLDWSESILVAAYFATEPSDKTALDDAVIWCLNPYFLNTWESGNAFGFSHSSICVFDQFLYHPKPYDQFIVSAFSGIEDSNNSAVIAVAPREIDLRLTVQSSFFTIHGFSSILMQPLESKLLVTPVLTKCTISAASKSDIQKQLRKCGVSRASLFPDLTNLAFDIKTRNGF